MFVVHCLPWSTVQKRFMVLFMFFDWRGEGVLCLKIFPFPPCLPPPTLLISDVLSFSPPSPLPQARQEREYGKFFLCCD